MKNYLTILVLISTLIGCARSEGPQEVQIDQTLKIYYKDTQGRDLLSIWQNAGADPIRWEDLLAARAGENVNFLTKKDSLGINYIEYQAGATRLETSDASTMDRLFTTEIQVNYTTDSLAEVHSDTLQVIYRLSPTRFFISKVQYNQQLLAIDPIGAGNSVTVVK